MNEKLGTRAKLGLKIWIFVFAVVGMVLSANGSRVEAAQKMTTKKKAVYVIKKNKKTYKGKYLKAKVSSDLVKLKGNTKVVKKINATLKKEYKNARSSNKQLLDYAKTADVENTTCKSMWDETTATVKYNKNGYLSVLYQKIEFSGGRIFYTTVGKNFSLKTGKELTITDVISGNEKTIRKKIKKAYFKKYATYYANSTSKERAEKELDEIKIEDFEFYLLKGNKVCVDFGSYVPGLGYDGGTSIEIKGNY